MSNLRMRDGSWSTCFLVSTPRESVALSHKVTNVLHVHITFELYRRCTVLAQCYRWQKFVHSSDCCRLTFRCLRCGGEHRSAACDSPRTTNLCRNAQTVAGNTPPTIKAVPCIKPNWRRLKNAKSKPTPRALTTTTALKPTTSTATPTALTPNCRHQGKLPSPAHQ